VVPRPRPLVEARGLTRVWGSGHGASTALDGVDLELAAGEFVAIVGPSGSGKSTLGALLAGIDEPTSGSLVIGGVRLDRMREDARARWRSRHLGLVLQDFSLLPTLTAAENVELGLKLAGVRRDRRRRARDALDEVGLGRLARRLPVQLSGGEQQRVAIARAIARRPEILVADEPTGSLDSANGEIVFGLIRELAAGGTTVVFITHDPALAAATPRVVTLVDGRIESDRCTQR
jgi:putative ABC transport system ATP-binding protein